MEQPFAFIARGPVADGSLPIIRETGTAINLGVQHIGAWTRCSNAGAIAFTMPALPVVTACSGLIEQQGATQITFSAGTGATIVCDGFTSTLKTHGQYSTVAWMYDPVLQQFNVSGYVTVT